MRKVLLAVDGSVHSEEAARLLSRLPHDDSMQLIILTVVQRPFVHQSYTTSELLEASYQSDKKLAVKVYQKVAALFDGANVDVEHEMRNGNVGQIVTEVAEERGCDLVVLGAKGHSQIHRLLLGSVSDYVSTHAPCSVLVVRSERAGEDSEKTAPSEDPLRLVIGCDGSDPSTAGLREIAAIPWGAGVEFHLLSVASYLYDFYGERNLHSETNSHFESVLAAAKEMAQPSTSHLETHLIDREHVGDGIVQFADQIGCDLVVIGETPRTALNRWLMGSVSRYVLRHVACSVWIARNRSHDDNAEGSQP